MTDLDNLAQLRKAYSELPDTQLLELAQQGKGEFVEGAYELVMSEIARRGLEAEIGREAQRPIDEGACGQPCKTVCGDVWVPPSQDELIPVMVLLAADDEPAIGAALEKAGIDYAIDSIHLREKDYPRLVMAPRGSIDQVIRSCAFAGSKATIKLW